MNDAEIFFLDVTVNGETRSLPFRESYAGGRAYSVGPLGAFCKRAGAKLWHDKIVAFRRADGWFVSHQQTILNRSGYALVGFADARPETSKHSGAVGAGLERAHDR